VSPAPHTGKATSTQQAQGKSVPCAFTIKGAPTPRALHPQRRGVLTQPSHPLLADHSSVSGQPGRLTVEKEEMWQHGHAWACEI